MLRNEKHVNKYGMLLEYGSTDMQTRNALQKCWVCYNISRSRIDLKNQVMYKQRIQKLQKELDIEVTNFENIEVYASDADYHDYIIIKMMKL